MQEPTLVILAAGMGSRFGGLKQITPIDDKGHAIIDYSMFDAKRAGFKKIVFIIKHEIEEDFKNAVGRRAEKYFDVKYVYQQLDMLPDGYRVPDGRVKPWGTGHAVLCCKEAVDGPFAVINSDDFYGFGAYTALYDFLSQERAENEHAMIAYLLKNTVTENGTVARGICEVENGLLTGVVERTKIVPRPGGAAFIEDDGETFLPNGTPVSMNLWAFQHSILDELKNRFAAYLDENLPKNPLKCEYFLPLIPTALIHEGTGSVRVLDTDERWFGVTYHDDLAKVQAAIREMKQNGLYPEKLWQ